MTGRELSKFLLEDKDKYIETAIKSYANRIIDVFNGKNGTKFVLERVHEDESDDRICVVVRLGSSDENSFILNFSEVEDTQDDFFTKELYNIIEIEKKYEEYCKVYDKNHGKDGSHGWYKHCKDCLYYKKNILKRDDAQSSDDIKYCPEDGRKLVYK